MKKLYDYAVLLFIMLCLFLLPTWAGAQKLEVAPYLVGGKSQSSDVVLKHGHGLLLNYSIFEHRYGDFGLFASLDMREASILGKTAGNLNTVLFGPSYRTPTFWKYFNITAGGGYAKAHDSDLDYTTTSTYKTQKFSLARTRCGYTPPPILYTEHARTVLTKAEFDGGWGLWATANFTYPVAQWQTLGLKLGGRYLRMGADAVEITRDSYGTRTRALDDKLEPFAYLAMLEWVIKF